MRVRCGLYEVGRRGVQVYVEYPSGLPLREHRQATNGTSTHPPSPPPNLHHRIRTRSGRSYPSVSPHPSAHDLFGLSSDPGLPYRFHGTAHPLTRLLFVHRSKDKYTPLIYTTVNPTLPLPSASYEDRPNPWLTLYRFASNDCAYCISSFELYT